MWHIEEVGTGTPSESCLIVIDPSADIDGVVACCREMLMPELQRVHVVFDDRCRPHQVQAFLKVIRDVIPEREYIIKHTPPLVIALIGYLWRRMQAYCEEKGR